MTRHYLTNQQRGNLKEVCHTLGRAFENGSIYLIGSVLKTESYRDVDVCLVLPDEEYRSFDLTFQPKRSVLSQALAHWIQDRTGLPIDFTFQMASTFDSDLPWVLVETI